MIYFCLSITCCTGCFSTNLCFHFLQTRLWSSAKSIVVSAPLLCWNYSLFSMSLFVLLDSSKNVAIYPHTYAVPHAGCLLSLNALTILTFMKNSFVRIVPSWKCRVISNSQTVTFICVKQVYTFLQLQILVRRVNGWSGATSLTAVHLLLMWSSPQSILVWNLWVLMSNFSALWGSIFDHFLWLL